MFNKSNYNDYRTRNYTTNVFNLPDEYTVKLEGRNDDVDRLKFYIENSNEVDESAIWIDVLYPITKKINDEVANYIMKYYEGKRHRITIKVTDPTLKIALSLPKTLSTFHVITDSIEKQFNIDSLVQVERGIFDDGFTLEIYLLGRLKR